MAKLKSLYSTEASVSIPGSAIYEYLVRNLTVEATVEGPQILISFTNPTISNFLKVHIVRKLRSYPLSPTDGVKVYEGTGNVFSDRNIVGGQCYYYTVFVELDDGSIYYDVNFSTGFAISFSTGNMPDYAYESTVRHYKISDSKTPSRILEEVQTDKGDYVNINEETDKHQLQRYFKTTKVEFDRIKSLIEYSPTLLDIDNCPEYILPYISQFLGVDFNADIPIEARRAELKNIIGIYKTKGTPDSITNQLQNISKLDVGIQEYYKNILKSNRRDRTSAKFGPEWSLAIGLEGDPSVNSLNFDENGLYDWRKYGLWFLIDEEETLTKAVIDKTNRIIDKYEPANAIHLLGAYTEIEEDFTILVEDMFDDQFEYGFKFDLYTLDNEIIHIESFVDEWFTDITFIEYLDVLYDYDKVLISNIIDKVSNVALIQSADMITDAGIGGSLGRKLSDSFTNYNENGKFKYTDYPEINEDLSALKVLGQGWYHDDYSYGPYIETYLFDILEENLEEIDTDNNEDINTSITISEDTNVEFQIESLDIENINIITESNYDEIFILDSENYLISSISDGKKLDADTIFNELIYNKENWLYSNNIEKLSNDILIKSTQWIIDSYIDQQYYSGIGEESFTDAIDSEENLTTVENIYLENYDISNIIDEILNDPVQEINNENILSSNFIESSLNAIETLEEELLESTDDSWFTELYFATTPEMEENLGIIPFDQVMPDESESINQEIYSNIINEELINEINILPEDETILYSYLDSDLNELDILNNENYNLLSIIDNSVNEEINTLDIDSYNINWVDVDVTTIYDGREKIYTELFYVEKFSDIIDLNFENYSFFINDNNIDNIEFLNSEIYSFIINELSVNEDIESLIQDNFSFTFLDQELTELDKIDSDNYNLTASDYADLLIESENLESYSNIISEELLSEIYEISDDTITLSLFDSYLTESEKLDTENLGITIQEEIIPYIIETIDNEIYDINWIETEITNVLDGTETFYINLFQDEKITELESINQENYSILFSESIFNDIEILEQENYLFSINIELLNDIFDLSQETISILLSDESFIQIEGINQENYSFILIENLISDIESIENENISNSLIENYLAEIYSLNSEIYSYILSDDSYLSIETLETENYNINWNDIDITAVYDGREVIYIQLFAESKFSDISTINTEDIIISVLDSFEDERETSHTENYLLSILDLELYELIESINQENYSILFSELVLNELDIINIDIFNLTYNETYLSELNIISQDNFSYSYSDDYLSEIESLISDIFNFIYEDSDLIEIESLKLDEFNFTYIDNSLSLIETINNEIYDINWIETEITNVLDGTETIISDLFQETKFTELESLIQENYSILFNDNNIDNFESLISENYSILLNETIINNIYDLNSDNFSYSYLDSLLTNIYDLNSDSFSYSYLDSVLNEINIIEEENYNINFIETKIEEIYQINSDSFSYSYLDQDLSDIYDLNIDTSSLSFIDSNIEEVETLIQDNYNISSIIDSNFYDIIDTLDNENYNINWNDIDITAVYDGRESFYIQLFAESKFTDITDLNNDNINLSINEQKIDSLNTIKQENYNINNITISEYDSLYSLNTDTSSLSFLDYYDDTETQLFGTLYSNDATNVSNSLYYLSAISS